MIKQLVVAAAFVAVTAALAIAYTGAPAQDDPLKPFKGNSCVECHSRDLPSTEMSNRYLQWYLSRHLQVSVSCDKCHGGDPATNNKEKSHKGVLPPAVPVSSVSPENVAKTCGSCHSAIADAFTRSTHSKRLAPAGLGPNCTTCHEHMASVVVTSPTEGANLCAQCHDAEGGMLPKKPQIPIKAKAVMESIERANNMVIWAEGLVEAANQKKVDISAEIVLLKSARADLAEAKATWHDFTLVGVQDKADDSFKKASAVKDQLRKKLGFN